MSIVLSQILSFVGKLDDSAGDTISWEQFRRFFDENAEDVGHRRERI